MSRGASLRNGARIGFFQRILLDERVELRGNGGQGHSRRGHAELQSALEQRDILIHELREGPVARERRVEILHALGWLLLHEVRNFRMHAAELVQREAFAGEALPLDALLVVAAQQRVVGAPFFAELRRIDGLNFGEKLSRLRVAALEGFEGNVRPAVKSLALAERSRPFGKLAHVPRPDPVDERLKFFVLGRRGGLRGGKREKGGEQGK